MKLNVKEAWQKAINEKIDIAIGNNSPTITYQEFFLYWVLRIEYSNNTVFLETDTFYDYYKGSWIDEQWAKSQASKFNKTDILIPWEKVFK